LKRDTAIHPSVARFEGAVKPNLGKVRALLKESILAKEAKMRAGLVHFLTIRPEV
jgi:hypothetical protein